MSTIDYSELPNSIITPNGSIAWRASDLPLVMDYVVENGWMVLGGDVLTCLGNYTHDSWYYNPDCSISITQNIKNSVAVCLEYVAKYTKRNGTNFLFSLVLSDSFLAG